MLPHVIITRSYCSPARLLPPLSWRGSGQGQGGRAGRAETEYYHWGESCFMLPSGQAGSLGAPSLHLTGNTFQTHTRTQAYIKRYLLFLVFFLMCCFYAPSTDERCTFTCRHSQRHSPCSPSIAIERSISHFTTSYTFLCHSQLLLHSNGRLAQQRRPRGSSPSLLLTHTLSNTHQ